MKYRIVDLSDDGFDVLVEDGGVVSVHKDADEGIYVSTYYQNKIDTQTCADNFYEALAEGKAYIKDWDSTSTQDEIVQDALQWLVKPSPKEWTQTNDLFQHLFN